MKFKSLMIYKVIHKGPLNSVFQHMYMKKKCAQVFHLYEKNEQLHSYICIKISMYFERMNIPDCSLELIHTKHHFSDSFLYRQEEHFIKYIYIFVLSSQLL